MRRGHVTASVASRFAALANMMLRCSADSVALRQLMDTAPHRLVDAWHGSFRGNPFTQAGNRNEPIVFSWVARSDFVLSLFEAGLAESRRHCWMATSPDGIGNVNLAQLAMHLRREFPGTVEALDGVTCCHLTFEFKTFAEVNTNKYQAIVDELGTAKGWMACSMASENFTRMVPNIAYRRQLIHAAATFAVPAVIFVAATERSGNPIISQTLVVADAGVIEQHVAMLQAIADELFGWVFRGPTAHAPDWMNMKVAQQLESHQVLWWTTRMTVLREGPLHPVETMRLALVVIYNKYVHLRTPSRIAAQLLGCLAQYDGRRRWL